VLVMLATALLAAGGFGWVQARLPRRAALLLAVPFLLTAVEFVNIPPLRVYTLLPAPSEYGWLRSQPSGILVEYPLNAGTDVNRQQIQTHLYTVYQPVHGHPLFNGGNPGSRADQLSGQLEPYYAPGVVDQLRSIGVRYLFVHRADYLKDGLQLPADVPGLTYVATMDGVDVYTVG
jgi:hypothetical protein